MANPPPTIVFEDRDLVGVIGEAAQFDAAKRLAEQGPEAPTPGAP